MYQVWVDDGEGWRFYGNYETEDEALLEINSFPFEWGAYYEQVDKEE